uniref:Uncharacterized protein n=1 Tax=Ignisphaera aggregans TaxID=334771 RepID=A0A7C4FHD1_9CREN
MGQGVNLKVYRNSDVLKVVGFIPPGHTHMRLAIVLRDQVIVLQEASVAAIVRAYVDIVTHPTRKAVEFTQVRLSGDSKKPGYAEYQLIESNRSEDEVVGEWSNILRSEPT